MDQLLEKLKHRVLQEKEFVSSRQLFFSEGRNHAGSSQKKSFLHLKHIVDHVLIVQKFV